MEKMYIKGRASVWPEDIGLGLVAVMAKGFGWLGF